MKGKTTIKGICLLKNLLKTTPNEIAIIIYKTLQTGPKSQEGGAHVGFTISLYQDDELFISILYQE